MNWTNNAFLIFSVGCLISVIGFGIVFVMKMEGLRGSVEAIIKGIIDSINELKNEIKEHRGNFLTRTDHFEYVSKTDKFIATMWEKHDKLKEQFEEFKINCAGNHSRRKEDQS